MKAPTRPQRSASVWRFSMANPDEGTTRAPATASTPALQPLTKWSDKDVIAAYDQESQERRNSWSAIAATQCRRLSQTRKAQRAAVVLPR